MPTTFPKPPRTKVLVTYRNKRNFNTDLFKYDILELSRGFIDLDMDNLINKYMRPWLSSMTSIHLKGRFMLLLL